MSEEKEEREPMQEDVDAIKQHMPTWAIKLIISIMLTTRFTFITALLIIPAIIICGVSAIKPVVICGLFFIAYFLWEALFKNGTLKRIK